jgi:hypothetical protein
MDMLERSPGGRVTEPSASEARQEEEAALLALLERVFAQRFGPRAWGRVTVQVQEGRARTLEWSETVKAD